MRRLKHSGYDPAQVCGRLRIKTVSALEDDGGAIGAARSELARVCANESQVISAWNVLCQDALSAIETRGRRSLSGLFSVLRASGIHLIADVGNSPAVIGNTLLQWTMSRTESFQVLGIQRPLPIDQAWLPLTAYVCETAPEPAYSAEEALARYHAFGERSCDDRDVIDTKTIGTFNSVHIGL